MFLTLTLSRLMLDQLATQRYTAHRMVLASCKMRRSGAELLRKVHLNRARSRIALSEQLSASSEQWSTTLFSEGKVAQSFPVGTIEGSVVGLLCKE